MIASSVRRSSYHGFLLEEFAGSRPNPVQADLAIFVAGWETRCIKFAQDNLTVAKHNVVLEFDDQGMTKHPGEYLARNGKTWTLLRLGSHYDMQGCMSKIIEMLQHQSAGGTINTVFLDISSMPKLVIQWITMELMRSRLVPEVFFGYVPGRDRFSQKKNEYDQGVRKFETVPHSIGDGGASVRKACIAGLGADERLLSHYFENESGFDRHFLIASLDTNDPAIVQAVEQQIAGLSFRHQLGPSDVAQISATSVLDCIAVMERFVRSSTNCDSWEVFCSGPKLHAVAGCFLSLKHRNVRLVGRVPQEYVRKNVDPGESICLLRCVDLTNPRVVLLKGLRRPLGSSDYVLASSDRMAEG
jgi:hypothetical protein